MEGKADETDEDRNLGAGHVGTHCALSLMFRGLANEIVLIDTDEEKAKSQALDLDDMGACLPAKL